MSGARGGGRRGGGGGRVGGGCRAGGGGRGNINMTQVELNTLLQQQVNMAMANFQAGINAMGGEFISFDLASFLGFVSFRLCFTRVPCFRYWCQSTPTSVLL